MTLKEVIEFFKEQQEIFGEDCIMYEVLTIAFDIFGKIEKCDETSATRCFTCINEIKKKYKEREV
jgi:hypothetical protein